MSRDNSDKTYLSHLKKEHDRLLGMLAPLSYLWHIPLSGAKTGQLVSTLTQYQQEQWTAIFLDFETQVRTLLADTTTDTGTGINN